MNVIIGDYLSAIIGTFREGSNWCLNPLEEIRKGGKTTVKRAEGNVVSVEFNLLYRVSNSNNSSFCASVFLVVLTQISRCRSGTPLSQTTTKSGSKTHSRRTSLMVSQPKQTPTTSGPRTISGLRAREWPIGTALIRVAGPLEGAFHFHFPSSSLWVLILRHPKQTEKTTRRLVRVQQARGDLA